MGEKKYDVFISYRRDGGSETAKHLSDLLVRDGYSVCFDIDTLREGRFDTALLRKVDECTDFILVVDKRCFNRTVDGSCKPEDDWLRMELACALQRGKNVVPVLLAGAVFPGNLPDDIKEVKWHNGPTYSQEYFDQFYEKLKGYLHSKPSHTPRWVSWLKRHLSAIIILLLLVVLGIVLVKGGMLPIRKTVAPVDSIAQLTENGDTVPEALLHQLSAQDQSVVLTNEVTQVQSSVQAEQVAQEKATVQTEPVGQPTVQTVSPVEQKKEEAVQQSSASVSVRQENGNLFLRFKVNDVEFKMVKVEGGTFEMGATREQGNDAFDNEKPVHWVTLSDYYIGETEVTQGLWKAVMGSNPSWFKGDGHLPVEQVSWDDAQEFIVKLNRLTGKVFRLPTEAEWEYAARGGKKSRGYKYSGSNSIDEVACYMDGSVHGTRVVKGKKANELGLYDMSGNVWEWCNDWYGDYSSEAQDNPQGSKIGPGRVSRGGSCYNNAKGCRVSIRNGSTPSSRINRLGFRVVLAK